MTLPNPHVWHDHDGSPDCPVPVGTVVELANFQSGGWASKILASAIKWSVVTRYRVHSYPEKPA